MSTVLRRNRTDFNNQKACPGEPNAHAQTWVTLLRTTSAACQVTSAPGNADLHSCELTTDRTSRDSLAAGPWVLRRDRTDGGVSVRT